MPVKSFPSDYSQKASPVGADKILIADSADSDAMFYATAASLPVSTAQQAALDAKQDDCEEKSADFAAAVHGSYIATATLTVTDPTPQSGHGFEVLVRNGTATVGGVAYATPGTYLKRVYHSGAWVTYVYAVKPTGDVVGTTDAQVLTNKRVNPRVVTVTQSATPAVNTDNGDLFIVTGLAQAITGFTVTGTPVDGQEITISLTDNGTARAITWGTSFEASTVTLPTTTVINARLDTTFRWNVATSKWRCVAKA